MAFRTLQLRRDTAANWTSADPTLAAGEFGYETDTAKLKIGDGSTAWTSLDYFGGEAVAGSDTQVQYNDGGSMAGDSDLTWNKTTEKLSAKNIIIPSMTTAGYVTNDASGNLVGGNSRVTFEAERTSSQSIPANTFTKVQFNVENWDTGGDFDPTTNYRFTAPEDGYYISTGALGFLVSNYPNTYQIEFYKNGSRHKVVSRGYASVAAYYAIPLAGIFELDEDDYIEVWVHMTNADNVFADSYWTHWQMAQLVI